MNHNLHNQGEVGKNSRDFVEWLGVPSTNSIICLHSEVQTV